MDSLADADEGEWNRRGAVGAPRRRDAGAYAVTYSLYRMAAENSGSKSTPPTFEPCR
jgi:hypothetical protein